MTASEAKTVKRRELEKAHQILSGFFSAKAKYDESSSNEEFTTEILESLDKSFGNADLIDDNIIFLRNLDSQNLKQGKSFSRVRVDYNCIERICKILELAKEEIKSRSYNHIEVISIQTEIIESKKLDSEISSLFSQEVYKIYEFISLSKLGEALIFADEEDRGKTDFLGNQSWRNIFQIFKSAFITYHTLEGSIEKIKVCKDCCNLFISKDKIKIFCSLRCKNRSLNIKWKDVKKCYQRQKSFLNNAAFRVLKIKPIHVTTKDCRSCTLTDYSQKGGQCPVLIHNNKEFIEEYSKFKNIRTSASLKL